MSFKTASDCFKENIQLTGGAAADPVSFNLYNGLFNLTQQVDRELSDLERKVDAIQRKLNDIEYAVGRQR